MKRTLPRLNGSAIQKDIKITFDRNQVIIPNTTTKENLFQWFCINRIPMRFFHVIPKHGENGRGYNPQASPLMCSRHEAQKFLDSAIGEKISELFNFDSANDMVIGQYYS